MKLIHFIFVFLFVVQVFSQSQKKVDFTRIDAEIKPYSNKFISGVVRYHFTVNTSIDSIAFDAINMEFSNIHIEGKKISNSIKYDGRRLKIGVNLNPGTYQIGLGFTARPKQTVYFVEGDSLSHFDCAQCDKLQIWTQGQGKYTSHWLPSFDDMNEKIEFDLTVRVPAKYTVIANGKLVNDKVIGDLRSWKFDMTQPMSSYLAAFVIGNFDKKVIRSSSGIPIELYYVPKDSLKVEPTYRYTKEIFDFLEKEIGVAYPWQNYKQVPVQDFLYAGMENTTCTIFSDQYVIDSTAFVDKNYVNINAHELAHQWFGNLVTEQSGNHHWLHEGFATYYAYLAEQSLFGNDHFYWRLYETAKTLHNLSENGDGEALTNPNANSLTFYEKGAWALVMLRDRVGDTAFRKGIQNYLNNYAFGNVTIDNFLTEMEKVSGQNLVSYRTEWLESEEFHLSEVQKYLDENSSSLHTYFQLNDSLRDYPERFASLMKMWNGFDSDNLKSKIIADFTHTLSEAYFMKKLKKESIKVRQAMLLSMDSIPKAFKETIEGFLSEPSYVSQEAALFKLWQAFPEDRLYYLHTTSSIEGLPNKNVRLLWLTLALVTPEVSPNEKKEYYQELNSYTNAQYNFEVRQLAFQYLFQIQALNDGSIKNLLIATNHHVWQFKKSSRNLIRSLATTDKERFETILKTMPQEEQTRIKKIITP